MVRDSNSGHQLLSPPANWCPIFAVWTTQVRHRVRKQYGKIKDTAQLYMVDTVLQDLPNEVRPQTTRAELGEQEIIPARRAYAANRAASESRALSTLWIRILILLSPREYGAPRPTGRSIVLCVCRS